MRLGNRQRSRGRVYPTRGVAPSLRFGLLIAARRPLPAHRAHRPTLAGLIPTLDGSSLLISSGVIVQVPDSTAGLMYFQDRRSGYGDPRSLAGVVSKSGGREFHGAVRL
jgi:hypothetical protein